MAELRDKLPTEMKGYVEVQRPPEAAPSFLESLANFGTKAIGAVQEGNAQTRRRKAAEADAAELAAKNAAAAGAVFVKTGDMNGNPAVAAAFNAAKDLAPRLVSQQEAANQGRGAPEALRVRREAMVRELIGRFPGQEYTVLKALKEFGVEDTYATKEYDRAEKQIDTDIERANMIETEYAKSALELGYGDWGHMSEADKAKTRPLVDQYNRGLAAFKQADQLLELKTKEANLTKAQREEADVQEDKLRVRGFMDTMGPMADAFLKNMEQVFQNPELDDATKEKLLTKLGAWGKTELPRAFNQAMGLYGAHMEPSSRELVTSQFERMQKAIDEMLTGNTSVIQANKRMFDLLTTKMGIDVQKALPFWSYLKNAVGGETLSTLFTNDVLGNPETIKKLQTEFQMAQDLAPGEERLRFNNVIKILKGDGKLVDYTPEEVRQHAPLVLKTMNAMARNDAITNGTDEQSHKEFMRTIENTSSVAVEATPQWGVASLKSVAKSLLQPGVFRGLVQTTKNRDERTEAINAYQPALQSVYTSLSSVKSGDKFYDLQWDNTSASWKLKWNGQYQVSGNNANQIVAGLSPVVGGQQTRTKPRPSDGAVEQARLLNLIIDRQTAFSRNGWDPTAPANLTDRERRLYYGQGIPHSGMKEDKKNQPKTAEENVNRMIQEFSAGLNASEYRKGDVADLPTAADIAKKHEKNPNFAALSPLIEGEAKQIDMPLDVAMRLFDKESGFNPTAESKAGAYGPGQITPATAKLYGVDDIKSLTPEQNVKLAFRILKDNFKKFGNWVDAISAYHSGRSLAAAAAAGASDGLIATKDYVASIAGDVIGG